MMGKLQAFAERFGWGVVVAALPYANGLMLCSLSVACFFFIALLHFFGVHPGPPSETLNPLAWLAYLLILFCYGWSFWWYSTSLFLVPLGLAWSVADLILSQAENRTERLIGAVAGIVLTVIPIIFWFQVNQATGGALRHFYWPDWSLFTP